MISPKRKDGNTTPATITCQYVGGQELIYRTEYVKGLSGGMFQFRKATFDSGKVVVHLY